MTYFLYSLEYPIDSTIYSYDFTTNPYTALKRFLESDDEMMMKCRAHGMAVPIMRVLERTESKSEAQRFLVGRLNLLRESQKPSEEA